MLHLTSTTRRATVAVLIAFALALLTVQAAAAQVTPASPEPAPSASTGGATGDSAADAARLCVLRDGELRMVQGVTISAEQRSAGYAAGVDWFIQRTSLSVDDRSYSPFGRPRDIPAEMLQRVGQVSEVPLFAEAGDSGPWQVIYVPVQPGCVFQPYTLTMPRSAARY